MRPSVGVVIPALNEEKVILQNIEVILADKYVSQVVVVDGGSTDRTAELVDQLAQKHGTRLKLATGAAGRGAQMNLGARQLSTDWIIFHHADSLLPARAGAAIAELGDDLMWGGFRHQFMPSNWKLAFISMLHNLRCRLSGVVYGDQSLFIRRSFFYQVGEFDEFGIEDLQFSDRALELFPSFLLSETVQTESRKFRQIGEFRALLQTAKIVIRFERNRKVGHDEFFKDYR